MKTNIPVERDDSREEERKSGYCEKDSEGFRSSERTNRNLKTCKANRKAREGNHHRASPWARSEFANQMTCWIHSRLNSVQSCHDRGKTGCATRCRAGAPYLLKPRFIHF